MDSRKLGWLALGVGVIALLISFGGNMHARRWYNNAEGGPRYTRSVPAAPEAQQAAPAAPAAPASPRGEYQEARGFSPHHAGRSEAGWNGPRPFGGGFFFGLKLFGTLVRSALFLLILFMLVRWFARRKDVPPTTPPSGPEQEPYTGGTKSL